VIQLTRDRTRISSGFRGQHRINREKRLLRQYLVGEAPTSNIWRAAKDQLRIESHGKCAYCEGKADHVAYGDVEHFRPKSVYWWLAYCYDNFTFSCQLCNQQFKVANFPIDAHPMAAPVVPQTPTEQELDNLAGTLAPDPATDSDVQTFQDACALEDCHLPDPYVQDPEQFFSWEADEVIREVEIRPRSNSARNVRAYGAVKQFLGLNREELMRWRFLTYDLANTLVRIVKDASASPAVHQLAAAKLQDMMKDEAEFAAMVRYLVRVQHGLSL